MGCGKAAAAWACPKVEKRKRTPPPRRVVFSLLMFKQIFHHLYSIIFIHHLYPSSIPSSSRIFNDHPFPSSQVLRTTPPGGAARAARASPFREATQGPPILESWSCQACNLRLVWLIQPFAFAFAVLLRVNSEHSPPLANPLLLGKASKAATTAPPAVKGHPRCTSQDYCVGSPKDGLVRHIMKGVPAASRRVLQIVLERLS